MIRGMDMVDTLIDLRDVLPCLTEKQAEALGLWYEGYAQREIGERLEIGRTSVQARIDGALKKIRQSMS